MKRNYVLETPGEMKAMYQAYNEEMVELARKNGKIVLLYGDFPHGAAGAEGPPLVPHDGRPGHHLCPNGDDEVDDGIRLVAIRLLFMPVAHDEASVH